MSGGDRAALVAAVLDALRAQRSADDGLVNAQLMLDSYDAKTEQSGSDKVAGEAGPNLWGSRNSTFRWADKPTGDNEAALAAALKTMQELPATVEIAEFGGARVRWPNALDLCVRVNELKYIDAVDKSAMRCRIGDVERAYDKVKGDRYDLLLELEQLEGEE